MILLYNLVSMQWIEDFLCWDCNAEIHLKIYEWKELDTTQVQMYTMNRYIMILQKETLRASHGGILGVSYYIAGRLGKKANRVSFCNIINGPYVIYHVVHK